MLRKIRIAVSAVLLALITLFFMDFAELLPQELKVLKDVQLVPAVLALNGVIIVALVVLTLIFGRVYCSSLCPLGIYQDVVSRLRKWTSKRKSKKRYKYLPPLSWLRYGFLGAMVLAFFTGLHVLVGLLDPYSAFGRMTVHLFKPVYQAGNNLMFSIFTSFGDHSFYKISIYLMSVSSLVVALVTIATVSILAWRNGRIYCNTVCPVGTTLGLMSRFSLFQIRFDSSACTLCGSCARNCKSSCIDFKQMTVDTSRCVTCFNCIDSCKESGLKYRLPRKGEALVQKAGLQIPPASPRRSTATTSTAASTAADLALRVEAETQPLTFAINFQPSIETQPSAHTQLSALTPVSLPLRKQAGGRRRFLAAIGITGLAAARLSAEMTLKLGPKRDVGRRTPIMPPGAGHFDRFTERCTSCHLCVAKCPVQVIKPSFLEYGIGGMLQPMMNFDHQFCNYDCTICSDVCPTEALLHLTKEAKHHNQMGVVQLHLENCIVYTDETSCGACSEHCPTQAVHMVHYKGSLTIPAIEQEICVGCGGCEYVCPSKPWKAIYVEGIKTHHTIELAFEEAETHEIDDFGF